MILGFTRLIDRVGPFSVWARGLFCLMAISPGLSFGGGAWAQDRSLVTTISIDYCADQYVLALADRSQIKGLSRGADEDYSFHADKAQGLPKLYGTIDEVLYHEPDTVVLSWGLTAAMKALAREQGIDVIEVTYGSGPDVVLGNLQTIGKALGQEARAAGLVADYRLRLERLRGMARPGLRAAYVTPSGFTSGVGTFVDEILLLAGLDSWAAARGLHGWQPLPLEDLVLDPPDLFITSFFDTSRAVQSNWSLARHGRLAKLLDEVPGVELPGRYLACNGLFLTDAAERIRKELEAKQ